MESTFAPEENVIIGNVAFYGATTGKAFINGKAGERFCVRNSGVQAVVEGIGDHGCEYMTGGTVVVLGGVGRNFGAGMSGGIAFVYDKDRTLVSKSNTEGLNFNPVENTDDLNTLKDLVEEHYNMTLSPLAQRLLENWEQEVTHFVKVLPEEYRLALLRLEEENTETV